MFWRLKNIIATQKLLKSHKHLTRDRLAWLLNYSENLHGGGLSYAKKVPLDDSGQPFPWITYPALEYINQFDFSKCTIFEYGSGNSSRFWAQRCHRIISVESDKKWFDYGKQNVLSNQELLYRADKDSYAKSIRDYEITFDVIVIDGMYRYTCAQQAVQQLSKTGMIIFDNSDWCPKSMVFLQSQGLIEVDFAGAGPVNNYAWCTSLFLSQQFNIPRVHADGRISLKGSIEQDEDDLPIRH